MFVWLSHCGLQRQHTTVVEAWLGGADFSRARTYFRKLERAGNHGLYGALAVAVSGASWPEERLHAEGKLPVPTCQRCGAPVGSSLHHIWQCKAPIEDVDGAMEASKWLTRLALTAPEDEVCFWTRGIVPAAWLKVSPPADHDSQVLLGDVSYFGRGFVVVFTDGSGGQHSSDPFAKEVWMGSSGHGF